MAKPIILLADNDDNFLQTRREFLEDEGLDVKPASNSTEAIAILDQGRVDLAVIDLRLDNNEDQWDVSGLELARQVAPSIPKIIVSQFTNPEVVRNALVTQLNGLPPAVDFIDKGAGQEVLLTAIRRTLARLEPRLRTLSNNTAERLDLDYQEARRQTRWNFKVSLGVALIGTLIILAGIALAMSDFSEPNVAFLTTIAGLMIEVISALFFKRADAANERMDHYHKELLQIRQLEILLAACDELPTADIQENSQQVVIQAAMTRWFSTPTGLANTNTPITRE